MRIPWFKPLTALAVGTVLALPARADEPPEGGDERAKLKAQIEKVLKLMAENEQALLQASTQGGKAPKGPEIPLPDLPPGGAQGQPPSPPPQGSGGSGGGGQGGTGQGGTGQGGTGQGGTGQGGTGQGGPAGGGTGGEGSGGKARQAIDELLKGAAQGAGMIPGELEQLIKMLPTGSGGSGGSPSGSPKDGQPKGGQETPEAREAQRRKELEEQQRREQEKNGGQQPEGGKRDPNDPSQRAKTDPPTPPNGPQDPNVPPWYAQLPPEIREFWAGGGIEKLPPRLRKIVEEYQRSLDKQTRPGEGSGR